MATPIRDVEMRHYQYSSSPDLSSLPSESPSEPSSPSRHGRRRMSRQGQRGDEIVVDPSAAPRFALMNPSPQQQPGPPPALSLDSVRLNKDGEPRKKPGRKPGVVAKKASDGSAPSVLSAPGADSSVEAPKAKRPRKPKDPNAPPVPRKKRALPTSAPANDTLIASALPRSSSVNVQYEPKVELTSMRMDIDPRPTTHPFGPSAIPSSTNTHPHPRQPPLAMMDKMQKRESNPSSVLSILNADDSPPRPPRSAPLATTTTPVRSVGQSFDPVRSSTYDPVRETMLARDPYGTGALTSPRAPTQVPNRASASPSIASLVDPAPVSHIRSPVATFALTHQVSPPPMSIAAATTSSSNLPHSRFREGPVSAPTSPSPSPAIRNIVAPTISSTPRSPTATKATTIAKDFPKVAAATVPKTTSSKTPPLALTSKSSTAAKTSTTKASAKSDSSGQTKEQVKAAAQSKTATQSKLPAQKKTAAQSKAASQSKASVSTTAATSSKTAAAKPATTKAAEKKAAAAAAKAAATAAVAASAAATSEETSSPDTSATTKPSGPITASFKDVAMSGTTTAGSQASPSAAPHIKKFSSILQQERGGKQSKTTSAASSPKLYGTRGDASPAADALDSSTQSAGGEPERSILDFGKALPGEEQTAPSIVLHIPLTRGENNKYVNFMRMAEERYGWDALHPRLAAHRDRKLRIAAASAALEKTGSGRESGDEMTDDMQSGDEGSNEENGAIGDNGLIAANASGPDDIPAKPVRKKRIFKEDEYDKDDDFVDDSELQWEEQAAASRDGFFVYSGPLVPEEEKPAEGYVFFFAKTVYHITGFSRADLFYRSTTPAKRGRGTRGGRGGTGRATAAKAATGRGAGGAGSRGGTTVRKPRITKQEKEKREREKEELEKGSSKSSANGLSLADTESPFSSSMAIDI